MVVDNLPERLYFYLLSANVDDEVISKLEIFQKLNSLHEVRIKSIGFTDYRECLDAINSLIKDTVAQLAEKGHKYSFIIDQNPKFLEPIEIDKSRGVGILEKWQSYETIRYYLVSEDAKMDGVFVTKFMITVMILNNQNKQQIEEKLNRI